MSNHSPEIAELCGYLHRHIVELARLLYVLEGKPAGEMPLLTSLRPLSARELQIAELAHLPYDEIQERLGLAKGTVSSHMGSIFNKLGIKKRYELVELMHRHHQQQQQEANPREQPSV